MFETLGEKAEEKAMVQFLERFTDCLLYTSQSPRDTERSRMPSSA